MASSELASARLALGGAGAWNSLSSTIVHLLSPVGCLRLNAPTAGGSIAALRSLAAALAARAAAAAVAAAAMETGGWGWYSGGSAG